MNLYQVSVSAVDGRTVILTEWERFGDSIEDVERHTLEAARREYPGRQVSVWVNGKGTPA